MYKLKTITYAKLTDIEFKQFPEISSNNIENSVDYKNYIRKDITYYFIVACIRGRINIVKYLIKRGVNVEAYDNLGSLYALSFENYETLNYLIKSGVNIKIINKLAKSHPIPKKYTKTFYNEYYKK